MPAGNDVLSRPLDGGEKIEAYPKGLEGVNNIVEEYLVARGVAPVNSGGALAQQEMEEEFAMAMQWARWNLGV